MVEKWSFAGAGGTVRHDFDAVERVEFSDGPFTGFMEEIPIRPGLALYRAEGRATHAYSLLSEETTRNNMLIMGCMLSGTGILAADGNPEQSWRDGGQLFGVTASERPIAYHLQAGQHWRALAVKLEPDALPLLAEDDAPALVRDAVEDDRVPLAFMRPIGRQVIHAAQALMTPVYAGRMAVLHREAKVLELLAHQLDLVEPSVSQLGELTGRELARIREARERLLADLRNPPGLQELAGLVSLSVRRLNQGFRQLYGTTVFDYLRDARLDTARSMLDQGFALPLKQLAWHVGYGQQTNFINAFRRRFGLSPGAYRQIRDAEN